MHKSMLGLMVLAVTLAGCSDSGSPTVECDGYVEDGQCFPFDVPTDSTGVLRGIVVDPSITPVEGAKVTLLGGAGGETIADADGFWAFPDLEPGFYRVRAEMGGFDAVEAQGGVTAGEVSEVVKIQLAPIPGFQPFHNLLQWDGFFQCAAGVQDPVLLGNIVAANLCYLVNANSGMEITQDNSLHLWYDEFVGEQEHPFHVQVETVWESTQTIANSLNIRYETSVPGTQSITHVFGSQMGTSPQKYVVNQTMAVEGGLGAATVDIAEPQGLAVEFFPGYDELNPVGMALEQRFTTFVVAFYDYAPPEDWAFVEDNQIPPP